MGVPGVYFPSICQPMKNKFIIRLMVRTARLDLALFTSCTRTAHTKWKTGEFNTKQLINKKHNAREQHPSVLLLFISHWKAAAQCWAYIFILFSSQLCCVFHFITLARVLFFLQPCCSSGKHTLRIIHQYISSISSPRTKRFGLHLNKSFENTNNQRPWPTSTQRMSLDTVR